MIIIAGALPLTTINKASASDEAAAVQSTGSVNTPASDEAASLAESPSQGTGQSDTEPLTATVVVGDDKLGIDQTSTVTITFSEPVTGFTIADLTAQNGTLSGLSTHDSITWTATLTPTAGLNVQNNVITFDLAGVTDTAGNPGTGTIASNPYELDSERPTATIAIANSKLMAGQTTTVTFTFSEAVKGVDLADPTVANGTLSNLSSSDGGKTWAATLTPTPGIQDNTNIITLDNTGVADLAGNAGEGTTNSANYEIDTVRPTATIVVADNELKPGETSLVTITFSEAVSDFNLSSLTASNGTLSNLTPIDGGTTWNVTLTPNANVNAADNFVTLDNSMVHNAAGNSLGEGVTKSNPYTVDTVLPSAALSQLTISSGTLSPAFVPETTSYAANVPYAVPSIKVNATTKDNSATMTVNGSPLASGQPSQDISLNVGANSIKVVVLAEDLSTKTYTISVTRANRETNEGGSSDNGSSGSGSSNGGSGSGSVSSGCSTTPVIPSDNKIISTDGQLILPPGKAGEVRSGDAISISVPACATKQELKLAIQKVTDTHPFITHHGVFLSPVFELSKNVPASFDKPVTLSFAFDPASLKSNQTAAVFYYDEAKKIWIMVPAGRIQDNRIAVTVDHFTKFAVLAIDQTTGLTVISDPAEFADISGHWAEASIKQAASTGIVTGYPDGTFKPGKTVTRAEFAVMLVNTLAIKKPGAELTFIDSASIGAWAQNAVAQVVQLGMMKGYENGTFRPNAEITRAEIAVTITNAVGQISKGTPEAGFADDSEIPDWAKGSAEFLKQTGIMLGKDGNRFAPQDAATRAEAVTVLLNMFALRG
ncbi:Ig-like domain-containing protein [Paenibacillus cellulositrophicus]|uniref:Ig-like domain-containing protein n=1 Tax=Paenibacillus cellulositrophicus TaxID=562959 RepID=UPI0020405855|nr:Ig-like domain-containing protein [Paenibacillus cellulositrophicus]MCM3001317.1 Ig-like domain-containing protein [Paenibacillus cellulositrophicus]